VSSFIINPYAFVSAAGPATFTSFDEYATGAEPDDWTRRFFTNDFWRVQASTNPVGSNVLRATGSTSDRLGLSWDLIDDEGASRDVIEVLTVVKSGTYTSAPMGLFIRSAAERFQVQVGNGFLSISRRGISSTTLASPEVTTGAAGDWKWLRFGYTAGGNLRAKLWLDGDGEPGAWTYDAATAPVSTGAGPAGVVYVGNTTTEYGFFSFAVGGDTAPGPP
jgi:hypothetical protein